MLNRQNTIFAIFLFLFLHSGLLLFSQNKISVIAENEPLSTLLYSIADKHNFRVAFDDDLLGQIDASLELTNVDIADFLKIISDQYGLDFRQIAGTYVLYVSDEEKVAEAIENTETRKTLAGEVVVETKEQADEPEITLSGFVQNLRSGEKLRFCRITINDKHLTLTNEMGYFQMPLDSGGSVKIEINHLGFYPYDTTLVIHHSIELEFGIAPIPLLSPLSRRSVTPLKFMIEMPDKPGIVAYSPQNVFQLPGTESNDLVNALTLIPGINYLKGADAGLSIRGGAPSDNLVLIDGIPIIETNHLMGNLSSLNSKFIQQAFVSRGGFGAEYGGRTSGIVDLTGKAGSNEKTVVDFTANLLHANIYLGVPISEKSALSAAFRKSFVDIWPSYHLNNFAFENVSIHINDETSKTAAISQTETSYSDVNIKLTMRPDKRKEISFNLFDSFDRQKRNYDFPMDGDYYQQNFSRERTSGYSFNLKTQSITGWLNAFSAGYNQLFSESISEYGKKPSIADQPVRNFFDSDNIRISEARATWSSELERRFLSQKFGVGYNYHFVDFRYEDHEVKVSGANHFNDSISAASSVHLSNLYYQAELAPLDWLKFRAGIRGLFNINESEFFSQPRYGIEVNPFKSLRFSYSGGRYMQQMYLTRRIDSYKNSTPMWFIPSDKNQYLDAFHHIAGTRFEYKNILLNIEAYQKRNMNKYFFIGENSFQGILPIVEYQKRNGEEINRGVDVLFQWRGTFFKHLVSYSLSESLERIEGVNGYTFFNAFDHQLHRLRVTEVVNWRNWTASVNWHYASGMPYLQVNSTPDSFVFGVLPHYMQLDFSLVKQFNFHYFYADVGITILNVLDRKNEIAAKNFVLPEGIQNHTVKSITTATSFSPLFYINLRYE